MDRYLRQRLRRRIPVGGNSDPEPTLDLWLEAPPRDHADRPLWRFWLWLIDEKREATGPSGGALWRLRVFRGREQLQAWFNSKK